MCLSHTQRLSTLRSSWSVQDDFLENWILSLVLFPLPALLSRCLYNFLPDFGGWVGNPLLPFLSESCKITWWLQGVARVSFWVFMAPTTTLRLLAWLEALSIFVLGILFYPLLLFLKGWIKWKHQHTDICNNVLEKPSNHKKEPFARIKLWIKMVALNPFFKSLESESIKVFWSQNYYEAFQGWGELFP